MRFKDIWDVGRILRAGLFDRTWYLSQNLDVATAGLDPLIHYLRRGAREGRDPHPLFDSDWYLAANPDVAGLNPVVHYLRRGASEGRDPHPLFDTGWYLAQNPEVAASGQNPLAHYLTRGASEGRDPHPLFDTDWYLAQNPEVTATGQNPLVHYLARGATDGCDPCPLFDSDWYLARNSDVSSAGLNPLVHYVRWGAAEGRNPSAMFDTAYYASQLPSHERDMNALVHFYTKGRAGGLAVNNVYDPARHAPTREWFAAAHADGRPTLLMVLHTAGGGVSRHVRDLLGICGDRVNVMLLQPRSDSIVSCREPASGTCLEFAIATQWTWLLGFLQDCRVARIHVHHLLGSEHYLRRLVSDLNVPFDFTAHDHYALSPQPHLVDRNGRFVGEDLQAAERELLAARVAPGPAGSLAQWRAEHGWLVAEADRFIVPSADASRRFRAHFPQVRAVVAAHPGEGGSHPPRGGELARGALLRIGLMGELAPHKGVDVLAACARLARSERAPLEFVILGSPHPHWSKPLRDLGVKISGRYEAGDLPRLFAEWAPHLLWFPAQCPETFSYTLSEAMRLGAPVVVTDLGALPERVGARPWTWIRPWDTPPQEWIAFFTDIRERHFATGTPPEPVGVPWPVSDRFYREEYLEWADAQPTRMRTSGRSLS